MDIDVIGHPESKRKREDELDVSRIKDNTPSEPRKAAKFDMLTMMRIRAICLQNEPPTTSCNDVNKLDGVRVMVENIDFTEDYRWSTGGETCKKKRTNRGHLVNGAYVQGEDLLEDVNDGGLEHLRVMGADEDLFNGARRAWRRRDDVGCARCFEKETVLEMCCEKPGPTIPGVEDSCLDGTGGNGVARMGRTRPNAFHRGKASTHQALPRAISKMGRFVVRRSGISTLGVYTSEAIPAEELLMEYVGEVVRREIAELREKKYMALGLEVGCYLFSLGPDWVIDATSRGNMARYINHSCEPNCVAQLVTPGGKDSKGAAHHRRVFVYAKKSIKAGEELSYDYKLSTPDAEGGGIMGGQVGNSGRIVCSCRAKRCRGFL